MKVLIYDLALKKWSWVLGVRKWSKTKDGHIRLEMEDGRVDETLPADRFNVDEVKYE